MARTKKALEVRLHTELTLSVEETAILLSYSRNHAYQAVKDGDLPSIRFGRAIRIPTAKLREMLGV